MYPPRDDRRASENLESPNPELVRAAETDRSEAATGDAAPTSAPSAPFDTLGNGTMPDPVPDMRRDALEEAAETSPEARERIQGLDRRETAVDPAFGKPRSTS